MTHNDLCYIMNRLVSIKPETDDGFVELLQ